MAIPCDNQSGTGSKVLNKEVVISGQVTVKKEDAIDPLTVKPGDFQFPILFKTEWPRCLR